MKTQTNYRIKETKMSDGTSRFTPQRQDIGEYFNFDGYGNLTRVERSAKWQDVPSHGNHYNSIEKAQRYLDEHIAIHDIGEEMEVIIHEYSLNG